LTATFDSSIKKYSQLTTKEDNNN